MTTIDSGGAKDVFEYGSALIKQLGRVEDIAIKFAFQNYTSCALVMVAYFSKKIPVELGVLAVLALSVNFTLAIAAQVDRFKRIYRMHRLTQKAWLDGKSRSELKAIFEKDTVVKRVLDTSDDALAAAGSGADFRHPLAFANLLPGLAAIVYAILYYLHWISDPA